ncbi:DUF368 domain-containing protein [Candidatus Protochlamydia phocaeensis]|uniref:DUF368 domain-containing protein n=1 Tax=Candidatus Protochlamydia phocaeensis TaxID=1414722 RepID=UPI0008392F2F|nr:DUF368 domain-containing protein [Candidatus Protochlamydia phocaeensis]
MSSLSFKGIYLFFCGLCMGAADLVPGISGGTVAFIMGFYQSLLESLKTINFSTLKLLFTFRFRAFSQQVAWPFLFTLGAGIICSLITLAGLFHSILSHEVYRVYFYGAFMGLILASFVFCLRQIKQWAIGKGIGLIAGALIAYGLTDLTLSPESAGPYAIKMEIRQEKDLFNYQAQQSLLTQLSPTVLSALLSKGIIQPDTLVYDGKGVQVGRAAELTASYRPALIDGWIVLCGAIAICALLLPGISGSYLLTLLGVYPLVIGALADFVFHLKQFTIDWEAASILLSLFIGIVIGAVCFARFVSWLLRHYPDISIAVLSGFMIGALRSVWPFWSYTYILQPLKLQQGPQLLPLEPIWPTNDPFLLGGTALCMAGGFAIVFLIEYLAKRKAAVAS